MGGTVVGEVVVVFDRGEGGGLAEESEVVDWDGGGEDGLDCWEVLVGCSRYTKCWGEVVPSSMPRPERRIGTMDIEGGEMFWVVYSAPRCVLAC